MIMTKTIYHRLGKKMSRKEVSGEERDKEAVKIFDCAVLARVAFKYKRISILLSVAGKS